MFMLLQELDGTLTSFSYTDGMLKKVSETTYCCIGF